MSGLEAFRKQAKQLVRWHREGNPSIAGRIRGLARYQDLTDAQALKLKFPLSEAQEIIAREAGFESWAVLKRAVDEKPPISRPRGAVPAIKAAIPVLFVSNVSRTASYFHDTLGFSIDLLHGNPPFYGGVSRNNATVHLRFVHEPVIAPELREKERLLAAFVKVEHVKALFEEYKLKDARFVSTLRKEPWGGPTFTVSDPDGNWICFCEA